jgi:hypothetical protein
MSDDRTERLSPVLLLVLAFAPRAVRVAVKAVRRTDGVAPSVCRKVGFTVLDNRLHYDTVVSVLFMVYDSPLL